MRAKERGVRTSEVCKAAERRESIIASVLGNSCQTGGCGTPLCL